MSSFLIAGMWVAIIYAPVFVIAWMTKHWLKKDEGKVLLVGLIFGFVGAGIAAAVLPVLTEEQLAARERRPARATWGELPILFAGVGVCTLILLGALAFLAWGM